MNKHEDKVQIDTRKTIKELMKEHNISRTTAWRSKNRGWFIQNYHRNKNILVDESENNACKKILQLNWLNNSNLSLKNSRISDLLRSKFRLSEKEYDLFKSEILSIKSQFRNFIEEPIEANYLTLLEDKMIKKKKLLVDDNMRKRYYGRGRIFLYKQDIKKAIQIAKECFEVLNF